MHYHCGEKIEKEQHWQEMLKRVETNTRNICAEIFTVLCILLLSPASVSAQAVSDSVFYRKSRPVIFRVNRTEIKPADRIWITDSLKPALDSLGQNGYVLARSAASPEGPTPNNRRLAIGRRDAANNILRKLGFDTDRIKYKVVTEDYDMLLVMMKIRQDKDVHVVDSLMKRYSTSDAALKVALQTCQGGKLWTRLLREYYPQLRATRMMLVDQRVYHDPSNNGFQPTFPAIKPSGDFTLPDLPMLPLQPITTVVEAEPTYIEPYFDPQPLIIELDGPIHRIPLLNVRSNLLYDAFYMPNFGMAPILNIGLEFYPRRGHFTYNAWFASSYYHKWQKHKFFQLRNYELEARFYFRKTDRADYHGWFMSLAVDNNIYGIGLGKRDGWEGEGLGGQFNLGYVLPLCYHKQWKLQFVAGVGYYSTRYDPYLYGTPDRFGHKEDGLYYYDTNLYSDDFKRRQHRFNWFGPTQVAINLSYDLLWRRGTNQNLRNGGGKARGISFRRWERR